MENRTHASNLFNDAETFLSELSVQEESLLSGGCGNAKNKSVKKGGQCKKSGSSKSRSGGVKIPVPVVPVVTGTGY